MGWFYVLIWLVLWIYIGVHQHPASQWPSVRGKLVEVYTSPGSLQSRVVYEYQVEGEGYQGRNIGLHQDPERAVGLDSVLIAADGGVDVYYNPDNPIDSCLVRPQSGIGLALIGVIPALIYLWIVLF